MDRPRDGPDVTPEEDPVAALARVGIGLVAGATLLAALSLVVLAHIAALVVVAAGLAAWAAEQRWPGVAGLWVGLVAAAGFLLVDLQVAPAGGTVARSALVTGVTGVAVLAAALVVRADLLARLRGR